MPGADTDALRDDVHQEPIVDHPHQATARLIHGSPAERAARGRAARKLAPRRRHADWSPQPSRPDPLALLESQAETRVPELVPIRYGRMLESPFAFFRGAALVMASDLADTVSSGFVAQLCGDAHLSNFGVFGTPERKLVFDINDFDETHPGPWEWDLKRLVASLVVAGRECGFGEGRRAQVVTAAVSDYRATMRKLARSRSLRVWYAHLEVDSLLAQLRREFDPERLARVEADVAKARTRDSMRAVSKFTGIVGGERRIISEPPLIVSIDELTEDERWHEIADEIQNMVAAYRETLAPERRDLLDQYRLVHIARKVVGVGSVGTRAWIALFLGTNDADPLVLQIKEAQRSVLEGFLAESEYENHAERVVVGQRRMQAIGDPFLGWTRIDRGLDGLPRDYYVRQLWDWKGSATIEALSARGLEAYGRTCAWTLARAHARSADRVAIASYVGGGDVLDRSLVTFAEAYADQNERDYAALLEAVETGRIAAERGL
jgi:uncharacterized protein (DUF2252 family)